MQKEATKQILSDPGLFTVRALARLAVLPTFDSSIGAEEWHRGFRTAAVVLLVLMLVISLLTKSAAVIGIFGTGWPGRHLIWLLLLGLSLPHLIAYAHPSYFQMFMNIVIPVIALSVAKIEGSRVTSSMKLSAALVLTILLCHGIFIYHMAHTRLNFL
jgi:hypothetical protein